MNVNSFSRLCKDILESEIISATCKLIFPNDDILRSAVSGSINLSQLLLIHMNLLLLSLFWPPVSLQAPLTLDQVVLRLPPLPMHKA